MTPQEMQELDAWLAENVMGAKKVLNVIWNSVIHSHEQRTCWIRGGIEPDGDWLIPVTEWHPTTNIAQAFEVVEKNLWNPKLQFGGLSLIRQADLKTYWWECKCYNGLRLYGANAETPSLTICLAYREAWEAK